MLFMDENFSRKLQGNEENSKHSNFRPDITEMLSHRKCERTRVMRAKVSPALSESCVHSSRSPWPLTVSGELRNVKEMLGKKVHSRYLSLLLSHFKEISYKLSKALSRSFSFLLHEMFYRLRGNSTSRKFKGILMNRSLR